ncbi:hypothetical protein P261_01638 [Lachnospiraceae bacterium TWA4]|nr:hypothetical protein P261_01638 [Lachnospiraceae bacterium TWA4]
MIQLKKGENDVSYVDSYIIYKGKDRNLKEFSAYLLKQAGEQLKEEAWAGNMDDDNEVFRLLVHRYVEAANVMFSGEKTLAEDNELSTLKETYVKDLGGLLTADEVHTLSAKAKELANLYQCGVYVVTVKNYKDYGITINDCTKNIYRDCGLGYGEGKDGFILCMSADDRDYAFLAYGDFGNFALTEYAFTNISAYFKGDFKYDDWMDGLEDYYKYSRVALEKAREGEPWTEKNDLSYQILINCLIYIPLLIFGVLLAFIVNWRLKSIMQPVEEATHAYYFVDRNQVKITKHNDRFINKTEKRRYDPPKSSSDRGSSDYGSSGSSGGGFSGGSGKY